MGRFLNADGYASTGQSVQSCNMFAYCENNPVNRCDPSGQFWGPLIAIVALVAVCAVTASGCGSTSASTNEVSNLNKKLASKRNRDIDKHYFEAYNCYGNATRKLADMDPTGYTNGDSTREVFEMVKADLGSQYVRELDSIDAPIAADEYRVALKCGPTDYHFICEYESGWYNKSGTKKGLYVDKSVVMADVWQARWLDRFGVERVGDPIEGYPLYTYETIYFAVKVGWDAQ